MVRLAGFIITLLVVLGMNEKEKAEEFKSDIESLLDNKFLGFEMDRDGLIDKITIRFDTYIVSHTFCGFIFKIGSHWQKTDDEIQDSYLDIASKLSELDYYIYILVYDTTNKLLFIDREISVYNQLISEHMDIPYEDHILISKKESDELESASITSEFI